MSCSADTIAPLPAGSSTAVSVCTSLFNGEHSRRDCVIVDYSFIHRVYLLSVRGFLFACHVIQLFYQLSIDLCRIEQKLEFVRDVAFLAKMREVNT